MKNCIKHLYTTFVKPIHMSITIPKSAYNETNAGAAAWNLLHIINVYH